MNRTPARIEALSPRSSISPVAFRHGPLKIAVLLLALALPLPAVAQKPTIQIIPFTSLFLPAEIGCGFDVLITPQTGRPNKGKLILFNDKGIISGPLFVTVKNLSTGKTIDLNTSGPVHFSFSDGLTIFDFQGATLSFLPAELAATLGVPSLALIHGRSGYTLSEDFHLTSFQGVNGTVKDVCQLLQ